jgi:WD40 repeat protein
VSAGDDGDMRVWCLDSGECERTLPIGDRPCGLDTSPDGSLALVSSTDFALRVWDLRSGAMVFRLPGEILRPDSGDRDDAGKHLGCACHIEWGGDGRRACSASSTELIEWETETWTEVGYIHGGDVRFDGFSRLAGTRRVVFALHDEIVVYELDGRARVASAAWAHGGATRMTATSPDGRWVACGSQAGPVGLWSVASFAGPVER